MWDKLGLIKLAFSVLRQVIAIRPEVVISTGAAPGFFAILFGKLLGAKTIWVDSIANADELSVAGKKVKPWADLWLTQWEHLQSDKGPKYYGSIL
jgi:UDP-N-acetylglucosamine:LPS N-acetylglucosamine transferase